MNKLLLISAVALLAGCNTILTAPTTPLGKFILSDAQAASALAKTNNDAAAQKCYDYIATDISNQAVFTPGLLYLNELKRTAATSNANLGAACGGVLPLVIAP